VVLVEVAVPVEGVVLGEMVLRMEVVGAVMVRELKSELEAVAPVEVATV
jgi:hypothetical protein